jgi:hypothetical protein
VHQLFLFRISSHSNTLGPATVRLGLQSDIAGVPEGTNIPSAVLREPV